MSLRQQIQHPIESRTEFLEDGKDKYMFCGVPDANVLSESILLLPEQRATLATHWTAVTGFQVSPDIVKHIVIVHKTLQPKTWDPDKEEWVDETPYDVTEIATLACKKGPLFLRMLVPAFKVLGLSEDEASSVSTFDQVASGNSEGSVPTS